MRETYERESTEPRASGTEKKSRFGIVELRGGHLAKTCERCVILQRISAVAVLRFMERLKHSKTGPFKAFFAPWPSPRPRRLPVSRI